MGDEHMPALFAAYAVALSARTGQLTQHAVDNMRIKAEEVLKRDHPAYPAVVTFATQYEVHRRDPVMLASLGETLELCLRLASAPAAPERRMRADLDG